MSCVSVSLMDMDRPFAFDGPADPGPSLRRAPVGRDRQGVRINCAAHFRAAASLHTLSFEPNASPFSAFKRGG
jgi:hypothetical protein